MKTESTIVHPVKEDKALKTNFEVYTFAKRRNPLSTVNKPSSHTRMSREGRLLNTTVVIVEKLINLKEKKKSVFNGFTTLLTFQDVTYPKVFAYSTVVILTSPISTRIPLVS